MQLNELVPFLRTCLSENKTFAAYRMPTGNEVCIVFSDNPDSTHGFISNITQQTGFVFAPFYKEEITVWLSADSLITLNYDPLQLSEVIDTDFQHESIVNNTDAEVIPCDVKEKYVQRIQSVVGKIKDGYCEKAVISRRIKTGFSKYTEAPILFLQLVQSFPKAFVYFTNINGAGCWIGASPELLLSARQNEKAGTSGKYLMETMALAGTRKHNRDNASEWGAKELAEQEWVTKYISEKLQSAGAEQTEVGSTYTVQAGPVEHLRTDFRSLIDKEKLGRLLHLLHPTPAVCGWPTDKARDVIHETEDYIRTYYTGFLGPVSDNGTSLFVNLRCMEILDDSALIYVGGGITADSDPEAEFKETVIKSRTLLDEIQKIRRLDKRKNC